jgi:hypothetical protein
MKKNLSLIFSLELQIQSDIENGSRSCIKFRMILNAVSIWHSWHHSMFTGCSLTVARLARYPLWIRRRGRRMLIRCPTSCSVSPSKRSFDTASDSWTSHDARTRPNPGRIDRRAPPDTMGARMIMHGDCLLICHISVLISQQSL